VNTRKRWRKVKAAEQKTKARATNKSIAARGNEH
jgi:hypothetical protein